MNVVIYARYSSASQSEQSIEGQINACKIFAQKEGFTIIQEYVDRAISATSADKRPAFLRMITHSEHKQFSAISVYQLDRFARNRYDSAIYKTKLKKNGVRVLSARENITDDASGILMETILEGMAEYYSKELSQKVLRGMELNVRKGLSIGGTLTFGYKLVDKHFVIDENKANIVRYVFNQYLLGKMQVEIREDLIAKGVKTDKNNSFSITSIHLMLTNKKYCGTLTFGDIQVEDVIPCIIDNNIFLQVNKLLSSQKKAPNRIKTPDAYYLLTTKLNCGGCGSPMTGFSGTSATKRVYQYYSCVTHRKIGTCSKKSIPKHTLEDIVYHVIQNILNQYTQELLIEKLYQTICQSRNNYSLTILNENVQKSKQIIHHLMQAIEGGDVIEPLTTQLKYRLAEQEMLNEEIKCIEQSTPQGIIESIKLYYLAISDGTMNPQELKRCTIDIFVNHIIFYDDVVDGHIDLFTILDTDIIQIPVTYNRSSSTK